MKKLLIQSLFWGVGCGFLLTPLSTSVAAFDNKSIPLTNQYIHLIRGGYHHGGHHGGGHFHGGWHSRGGIIITPSPYWSGPGAPPTWWCARHGWPSVCPRIVSPPVIVSPINPAIVIR